MARRVGVRTWGWETLESRVAMSHHHGAPAVGFGAVGDSLTDEYRFFPPDQSRARNWVEILAATRKVDFGAFTTASRGLPRDQGFANNWARYGATSEGVVDGQLPGLVRQVAAGTVKYASVNMGTNDFLAFLEQAAIALPFVGVPADFPAQLGRVEANAAANFDTTVNALLRANPGAKVVAATVPDLHEVPILAQFLGNPLARLAVDATEGAVLAYNAHIREVARSSPRVALEDLAAMSAPVAGLGSVPFGGATIDLARTGDDYRNFVLADKIHPGTVAQGQIASSFIQAVDGLGARIKPLGPGEIVRFAKALPGRLASTP